MARKCRHGDSYEIVVYRTIRGLAVLAVFGGVLARFTLPGHADRECGSDRDRQESEPRKPEGTGE